VQLQNTDHLTEYLRCQADVAYFIDRYVQIRHATRGIIPFRLWDWQIALLDIIEQEQAVIILKSRQLGVSELLVAYALWLVRFHPAKTTLFISKGEDDAKELLRRARLSYEHLPDYLQCGTSESVDNATIGEDNMGRFQIVHHDRQRRPHPSLIRSLPATVGAGRSASGSLVVLDEWAHQQFAHEIWAAVQPVVSSGGKLVGISTANGVGNTFHEVWQQAEAGQGSFRPVFLSWRRHPDRDDAWYAKTAADLVQPWRMHQEHPTTPSEAFIQSGRPVFPTPILSGHEERIRTEPRPTLSLPNTPPTVAQGLTVWQAPVTGHTYLIGADVAEGLEHGDYDAAIVVDRQTGEEVAELHGHWDVDVYAELLNWLGRTYQQATLAVERNNHGHAVLLALARLHHYPALYHHAEPLEQGKTPQARPGWPTTSTTKPLMIDALLVALRDSTYRPWSLAFLSEARVFAVQSNGSMSAPSGQHDDRVMSRAIAAYLLTQPIRTGHQAVQDLHTRSELRRGSW
jgi:hypothetical protein